jgi:hypothetical protein
MVCLELYPGGGISGRNRLIMTCESIAYESMLSLNVALYRAELIRARLQQVFSHAAHFM